MINQKGSMCFSIRGESNLDTELRGSSRVENWLNETCQPWERGRGSGAGAELTLQGPGEGSTEGSGLCLGVWDSLECSRGGRKSWEGGPRQGRCSGWVGEEA